MDQQKFPNGSKKSHDVAHFYFMQFQIVETQNMCFSL